MEASYPAMVVSQSRAVEEAVEHDLTTETELANQDVDKINPFIFNPPFTTYDKLIVSC